MKAVDSNIQVPKQARQIKGLITENIPLVMRYPVKLFCETCFDPFSLEFSLFYLQSFSTCNHPINEASLNQTHSHSTTMPEAPVYNDKQVMLMLSMLKDLASQGPLKVGSSLPRLVTLHLSNAY